MGIFLSWRTKFELEGNSEVSMKIIFHKGFKRNILNIVIDFNTITAHRQQDMAKRHSE